MRREVNNAFDNQVVAFNSVSSKKDGENGIKIIKCITH